MPTFVDPQTLQHLEGLPLHDNDPTNFGVLPIMGDFLSLGGQLPSRDTDPSPEEIMQLLGSSSL